MKLEETTCSVELAQKLKELDVAQDSIFYWIKEAFLGVADQNTLYQPDERQDGKRLGVSAFTSAELGEIIPYSLGVYFNFTTYHMEEGGWFVDYTDMRLESIGQPFKFGGIAEKMIFQSAEKEVDARAKLLIALKQNNLI